MRSSRNPLLAPSLLSANFARLADEIRQVEEAGADWLHFDIMDGHFVPNLTFGPILVRALRSLTQLPFDCHLMVAHPEDWIEECVKAGANWITVHAEATPHLNRTLHQIRDLGCKAGVSINPGTSLMQIEEVLDVVDLVLVMTVNPGFGGQKFIESCLGKIEKLNNIRNGMSASVSPSVKNKKGHSFLIEVDGGVDVNNIAKLYQAGGDVFVAGSAVFGSSDRKKAIGDLKSQLS